MDGLSNQGYKLFLQPYRRLARLVRLQPKKERVAESRMLIGVGVGVEGFQDNAIAPPIIASNPPSAVTTPKSEMTPRTRITIPQVCVEFGLLFMLHCTDDDYDSKDQKSP